MGVIGGGVVIAVVIVDDGDRGRHNRTTVG
jgi:hypothetical protein